MKTTHHRLQVKINLNFGDGKINIVDYEDQLNSFYENLVKPELDKYHQSDYYWVTVSNQALISPFHLGINSL